MKHLCLSLFASIALAACGGKSSGPKAPAAPVTPFERDAVRKALADTPQSAAPACGDPDNVSDSLGDLFSRQGEVLAPFDETFDCVPDLGDATMWECTWSEFARPSGPPSPDDPCGGGSSGYQIIVKVHADGVLDTTSITCVAPG